ncbi:MAG: hypothetical protein DRP10_01780 [Candidatus Aenigmatarchaeota archaeon]|nr:MAG: hypothetical protein DRP10_01780 [Candidatus Aenigmarchaeota archaeon]
MDENEEEIKYKTLGKNGEVLYEKPLSPYNYDLRGDISSKELANRYIENFKKKWKARTLKPGDILDFFSAKKFARDSGWDDMLTEIEEIEKEYYEDCLDISEVIEKKMRSGRKKGREEAEDMLNRIYKFAEANKIDPNSPEIKIQIGLLEMEMGL